MDHRLISVVVVLVGFGARAQSDGGLADLLALTKGPVHVATSTLRPGLRGYALEMEQKRLSALPTFERCDSLECLTHALRKCEPKKLVVNEHRYGCGLVSEKERRVGWYAIARHPAGGCGVLLFAGRGERVVADRWCRAVPLEDYEFACPDDAEVKASLDAAKKVVRKRKR